MSMITWSVKASKLCNLRCQYCYEWDGLDDPRRLSDPQWRRLLREIAVYHDARARTEGGDVRSVFGWHGGEPSILPVSYWESVIAAQRELLVSGDGNPLAFGNVMQTNLHTISDAMLDLVQREAVQLNVSFDGVAGVRVTAGGGDSEPNVLLNMARLRERGIPFGAAVVLSGNNHALLPRIYDRLEALGCRQIKIIPLLDASQFSATAFFAIEPDEMREALAALYRHWVARGRSVPVLPLTRAEQTVHLWRLRIPNEERFEDTPRNRHWIVDTNGDVYRHSNAHAEARPVGNLLRHSMQEIERSSTYAESILRDQRLVERHCSGCRYRDACDSQPVLRSPQPRRGVGCAPLAALCDLADSTMTPAAEMLLPFR